MTKKKLSEQFYTSTQALAERMGYEIVDITLDSQRQEKYLRLYIDKPGGISLDDCEQYHRALLPLTEDIEFDYLEVSSPGADRPLKSDHELLKYRGYDVVLNFYTPVDGIKKMKGQLISNNTQTLTVLSGDAYKTLIRKNIAIIRLAVDDEAIGI